MAGAIWLACNIALWVSWHLVSATLGTHLPAPELSRRLVAAIDDEQDDTVVGTASTGRSRGHATAHHDPGVAECERSDPAWPGVDVTAEMDRCSALFSLYSHGSMIRSREHGSFRSAS
jgi:hypothetical protein